MKRLFSILAFLWAFACVAAVPAVIVDQGKSPPPFDGINLPAMVIQAPATVSNSMSVCYVQPVIYNCMQVYDSFSWLALPCPMWNSSCSLRGLIHSYY